MGADVMTIVSALMAAVATPIGAWLGSRLMRAKYQAEVEQLRAEMQGKVAEVRSHELENVRKASDILMESIVPPLRLEIENLRNDILRLNKAIERIWACPHLDRCPVRHDIMRGPKERDGAGQPKDVDSDGHDGKRLRQLGLMARDKLDVTDAGAVDARGGGL